MLRFLLIATISAAIVEIGQARKCYQCSGTDEGYCGEQFHDDTSTVPIKDCDSTEEYCKVVSETIDNVKTITRDCSTKTPCDDKNKLYLRICRSCESDLCNSASIPVASAVTVAIGIAFQKFYFN